MQSCCLGMDVLVTRCGGVDYFDLGIDGLVVRYTGEWTLMLSGFGRECSGDCMCWGVSVICVLALVTECTGEWMSL